MATWAGPDAPHHPPRRPGQAFIVNPITLGLAPLPGDPDADADADADDASVSRDD